jgi:hypothetical protein
MKKLIAISSALVMLVASSGLFAQEEAVVAPSISWSGEFKTGLQFRASDAESSLKDGETDKSDPANYEPADPTTRLWNDDAGTRLRLNGAYTNGDFGVNFGLQYKREEAAGTFDLYDVYGTMNLFGGMASVKAGRFDGGVWRTGGAENFGPTAGDGIRVEVKPMAGLNVGFFLTPPRDVGHVADMKAGDFFAETAIGGEFDNDMFRIAAGLKLDGTGDKSQDYDIYFDDPAKAILLTQVVDDIHDNQAAIGAWLGFSLKMVPNLTAQIEAGFNNLGAFGGDIKGEPSDITHPTYKDVYWKPEGIGTVTLTEKFAYDISPELNAGLEMRQFIYGGSYKLDGKSDEEKKPYNAALAPNLRFKPFVSYKISDALKVSFEATYQIKQDYYDLKLDIKPGVTWKPSSALELGFSYNLGLDNYTKYAGKDRGDGYTVDKDGAASATNHTLQLQLTWAF